MDIAALSDGSYEENVANVLSRDASATNKQSGGECEGRRVLTEGVSRTKDM
jgi:hypothetical protein